MRKLAKEAVSMQKITLAIVRNMSAGSRRRVLYRGSVEELAGQIEIQSSREEVFAYREMEVSPSDVAILNVLDAVDQVANPEYPANDFLLKIALLGFDLHSSPRGTEDRHARMAKEVKVSL